VYICKFISVFEAGHTMCQLICHYKTEESIYEILFN